MKDGLAVGRVETSVFKHPFHYVTYEGLRRCLTRTSHDEGNKKHFYQMIQSLGLRASAARDCQWGVEGKWG